MVPLLEVARPPVGITDPVLPLLEVVRPPESLTGGGTTRVSVLWSFRVLLSVLWPLRTCLLSFSVRLW